MRWFSFFVGSAMVIFIECNLTFMSPVDSKWDLAHKIMLLMYLLKISSTMTPNIFSRKGNLISKKYVSTTMKNDNERIIWNMCRKTIDLTPLNLYVRTTLCYIHCEAFIRLIYLRCEYQNEVYYWPYFDCI